MARPTDEQLIQIAMQSLGEPAKISGVPEACTIIGCDSRNMKVHLEREGHQDEWRHPFLITVIKKSLADITDEDAEKVGEIIRFRPAMRNGRSWVMDCLVKYKTPIVNHHPLYIQQAIDFLRSRGYALPHGEYSVEDLVRGGFYQIK